MAENDAEEAEGKDVRQLTERFLEKSQKLISVNQKLFTFG